MIKLSMKPISLSVIFIEQHHNGSEYYCLSADSDVYDLAKGSALTHEKEKTG